MVDERNEYGTPCEDGRVSQTHPLRRQQIASPRRGAYAGASLAVVAVAVAVLAVRPLGQLRGTMLLVLVLPPLAHALDRLGWAEILARHLSGRGASTVRLLRAYLAWLVVSALLTLDVAAVVSTPVGLAIARRWGAAERIQTWAAILGSNVGSMLFPFSNLTNLLLVAGTGLGFTAYVEAAWAPQVAAGAAVGLLLVWRRRAESDAHPDDPSPTTTAAVGAPGITPDMEEGPDPITLAAGAVAALGAVAAVVVGVVGGDVALTFAVVTAIVAGLAVLDGAAQLPGLVRSIPISGVVIVLFAALARGPMVELAGGLPDLERTFPMPIALSAIALLGGLLAAAAFGAVWLVGASPAAIVAYLLGTNVLALLTPHGSLATILGRNLAAGAGAPLPARVYLLGAWPYALAGTVAGLIALLVIR